MLLITQTGGPGTSIGYQVQIFAMNPPDPAMRGEWLGQQVLYAACHGLQKTGPFE